MKATSNTADEIAAGREPNEMSRPTTSTRAGFMEAQGCGVQILMSAKTAIEMGCNIYGVVAYTATATDKAGRSVPACVLRLCSDFLRAHQLLISSPSTVRAAVFSRPRVRLPRRPRPCCSTFSIAVVNSRSAASRSRNGSRMKSLCSASQDRTRRLRQSDGRRSRTRPSGKSKRPFRITACSSAATRPSRR